MITARGAGAIVGTLFLVAACGGSQNPSGAKQVTVTIPYVGAITGPFAADGAPIGNSIQLAVDQAAPALAKEGIKLVYSPNDDRMDPAATPAVAQKVCSDSTVLAVAGPMFGIDVNAAGNIFTQCGLAMLTPGATAASLTTHRWSLFRMLANDDTQGADDSEYIVKVAKLHSVAVLDDSTQYGHGVALVVGKDLRAAGVTVTDEESVSATSTDYSGTISKVIASHPEGVFMGASITVQEPFLKQLRDKGYHGPYVAPDGALNPDLAAKAGPEADGTVISCACAPVPAYGGPSTGPLADFASAYKARFGSDPQAYDPEAYDAANIIIDAVKAGKRTRAAVLDYIRSVNYKGIAKGYTFRSDGELSTPSMDMYKVVGGQLKWIGKLSDLEKSA